MRRPAAPAASGAVVDAERGEARIDRQKAFDKEPHHQSAVCQKLAISPRRAAASGSRRIDCRSKRRANLAGSASATEKGAKEVSAAALPQRCRGVTMFAEIVATLRLMRYSRLRFINNLWRTLVKGSIASLAAAFTVLSGAGWAQSMNLPAPGIVLPDQSVVAADPTARLWRLRQLHRRPSAAVVKSLAGVAAPSISAASILTPTVNVSLAPATPTVSIRYSAPAGLSSVFISFRSETDQTYSIIGSFSVPTEKAGTIVVRDSQDPMSLYAAPGVWAVELIEIEDFGLHITDYSGTKLAAILPKSKMNVINTGSPDVTLPKIIAGKLLTPKVSVGSAVPYFQAKLTLADTVSGVSFADVFLEAPRDATGTFGDSLPPSPILTGSTVIGADMSSFSHNVGTWTILSYDVCDVAGNCIFSFESTDIKKVFGTTKFEVTK